MSEIRFPDGQVVTVEQSRPDFRFTALVPPRTPGPPAHRHRHETETFTVIEGRLRVRVGAWHRELGPGETLVVPPGRTHSFANPYDEPIRLRTVERPAGPLQAQFRVLAAAPGAPPLLALAAINAEHGYSFTLAGLPDVVQRPAWRGLAALARWRGDRDARRPGAGGG